MCSVGFLKHDFMHFKKHKNIIFYCTGPKHTFPYVLKHMKTYVAIFSVYEPKLNAFHFLSVVLLVLNTTYQYMLCPCIVFF